MALRVAYAWQQFRIRTAPQVRTATEIGCGTLAIAVCLVQLREPLEGGRELEPVEQ